MYALRSLLLLLLPLCPGPGPGPGIEAKVTRSCIETRQILGARGYSLSLLPPALISGEHLRICPQEYTCCSSEIEQRLTWETETTFRGLVEENGSFLVHTLAARHRKFDDGLLLLAEKIQGPFSFELAAQSIGAKISEGLMHLQENSVGVSAQVFQECGSPQPTPARARRAPAPREEVSRLWSAAAAEERPATAAGSSLPQLVWELRERLSRVRGFWAGLPLAVCGDPRMAADLSQEAAPCWTGAGQGRYLSPVVGGSQAQHLDNPELDAEASSPDLQTRRRRLKLRAATSRMKAAAQGRDLEQEDWEDASGSGEGQHYADDWMAGAAAAAPPGRPLRPPRRDSAGGKGGNVLIRHNQDRNRTGGTSIGFHAQPLLILFLSALALLGPR